MQTYRNSVINLYKTLLSQQFPATDISPGRYFVSTGVANSIKNGCITFSGASARASVLFMLTHLHGLLTGGEPSLTLQLCFSC